MSVEAHVEFLGEIYPVRPDSPLVIGREGDVAIDDNLFLHRRFLEVAQHDSLVWISNVGTALSATLSDTNGALQAWLGPGSQLPIVFPRAAVWFTAGPTTYEFDVVIAQAPFVPVASDTWDVGATTVGRIGLTPDQKLLILVLAEDVMCRGNRGAGAVPSSAAAATRLGWTLTKFNRKLDNVCDKLTRAGVRGLHGDSAQLATNRRARLVEYAVAARLVIREETQMLDALNSGTPIP